MNVKHNCGIKTFMNVYSIFSLLFSQISITISKMFAKPFLLYFCQEKPIFSIFGVFLKIVTKHADVDFGSFQYDMSHIMLKGILSDYLWF